MFPKPILTPQEVHAQRKQRQKEMVRVARKGALIRSSVILAELLGFAYFGSSALLLDALSSLVDVAATLFLILCVRAADKPPDREHPFGHGRFEPVAGLQLGLLLAAIGGGMFFQQLTSLFKETQGQELNPVTWVIPFAAVLLLEICHQIVKRTAKRENSPALLSEAVHYRVDSANSLFAMVALLFAAYFPEHSLFFDHLGALSIAALMIFLGVGAARRNAHQLIDRRPEEAFFDRVRKAAEAVPGVLATEKLLIQTYGPDAHVSLDIEVDPSMNVHDAHLIAQRVRAEIQKEWPAVRDVIVHTEPYFEGDHSL